MGVELNRGNNNCIPQAGISYVIIPEDCDVAEYVQRCYRNNTLSIGGGMGITDMHHVKVIDGVLDKIKFPSNGNTQGSSVIWIRENFYNKPLIIGVIPEGGRASNLQSNGQQRMYQEVAQRVAEVFLDALSSRVLITALGDLAKSAEVVIKASSKNSEGDVVRVESKDLVQLIGQSCKLNFTKDVEINIVDNSGDKDIEGNVLGVKLSFNNDKLSISDHWGNNVLFDEGGLSISDHWGNTLITNEDEVHIIDAHENEVLMNENEIHIIDAHENEVFMNEDEVHIIDAHENTMLMNEEHIQFTCSKYDIGEGKEQMVLGNTLVKLLGQLIDAICNMTVLTHVGASGTPINSVEFIAIKSKLETILSNLSNTD